MENEYKHLMEQSFALKKHGNMTLFEQDIMTAEDRAWWIERLQEENKKEQEAQKKSMGHVPRIPSIKKPHIPRK